MLTLLKNHVKTQLWERFFFQIFENFDQKSQKTWFCQKINFLAPFGQNFQNYCQIKNLKKRS